MVRLYGSLPAVLLVACLQDICVLAAVRMLELPTKVVIHLDDGAVNVWSMSCTLQSHFACVALHFPNPTSMLEEPMEAEAAKALQNMQYLEV
jgi:hypothetical protein